MNIKNCAALLNKLVSISVIDSVAEFAKISSFNLYMSSQMHVPLVNCRESSSSFSRTTLSHTEPATLSGF